MNSGGFHVTERVFFPVAVTVTFSGTVHRAARNLKLLRYFELLRNNCNYFLIKKIKQS